MRTKTRGKQSWEFFIFELNERKETELKIPTAKSQSLVFFLAFEHRIFAHKNLNLAVFLICFNNFPVVTSTDLANRNVSSSAQSYVNKQSQLFRGLINQVLKKTQGKASLLDI